MKPEEGQGFAEYAVVLVLVVVVAIVIVGLLGPQLEQLFRGESVTSSTSNLSIIPVESEPYPILSVEVSSGAESSNMVAVIAADPPNGIDGFEFFKVSPDIIVQICADVPYGRIMVESDSVLITWPLDHCQ